MKKTDSTATKTSATEKKAVVSVKETAAPAKKTSAKKAAAVPVKKVAAPVKAAKAAAPVKKVAAPVKAEKCAAKKAVVAEDARHHAHKKLKLTKAKQKYYINLLMEHRQAFMDQLRFHQDDALQSKKDSASERAGMATHMADLGTDNFRHDLELSLLSEEGDVIVMIDEALQRIQDSEYGICMDCGCEINEGRLEAKPYARYCTKCKSAREALEDPHRRHR